MSTETGYTAFLRDLPKDWKIAPLSAIAKVVGGGTPSRDVPAFWDGHIPWITPGEVSAEGSVYLSETRESISRVGLTGSGATILPSGSLMVTTRATLGARAINSVPMTTNQGFKSLVFASESDAPFFYYLTDKLKPELTRRASGTTFLEVSGSEFARIEVPVPPSRERQLIADVIYTLDTTIRQTEAIIEKLKQVKRGLLHDLLTRGIDTNGELRPPFSQAPSLYKDSPLGWIPKEWTTSLIGEEADIRHGFAFPGHLFTSEPKGLRLLVPGNFSRFGGLDFSEGNTKYFAGHHPPGTLLEDGEALIVMTDLSPMTLILGRAVLLSEGFPVLHNQRIGKFVFRRPGEWHTKFFVMLMNDDRLRSKVIAEATGTTVRHTSPDRIKAGSVARPSVEEQTEIAHRLDALVIRVRAEAAYGSKLRNAKSGLMDDLLTGRIRVTPLLDATP